MVIPEPEHQDHTLHSLESSSWITEFWIESTWRWKIVKKT